MAFEQPRSLFELKATRSEEFGLPSQMAKHYGIKGKSPSFEFKVLHPKKADLLKLARSKNQFKVQLGFRPTKVARCLLIDKLTGILFMTITMNGLRSKTQLNVFVQHGTYFLQHFPELSTYITVIVYFQYK
jgi:hypothetical protein